MTRPLPARLGLLASYAALALALVFAIVVAESRDLDSRPASGAVLPELRADVARAAPETAARVVVLASAP